MDSLAPPSSSSSGGWHEATPSPLAGDGFSRSTSHARNRGGPSFWVAEGWRHCRPFLPFVLISCLVVVLVYLLQSIVYGGPFTDPLFFSKFDQRWPRPGLNHASDQQENTPAVHPTEEEVAGLI